MTAVGTEAATVADLVRGRAADESTGLLAGDRSWTWREVVAEAERVADRLRAERVDGPFHVGVLLENTPEYVFALLGAALCGAVVVGVNDTRRGEELARDIRHVDCQLLLTDADGEQLLAGLDLGPARVRRIDDPSWPGPGAGPGGAAAGAPPTPDDLFVLLFTSGSTGAPKAVRMTHRRAAGMANGSAWFSPDDVLYCAMPLFHGNALNAIVLPALATGAAIALRRRFSASAFMPDVRHYGATFFSTVGRALSYVLATPPSPEDTEHRVAYALAPESSVADMKAFRSRFGIRCFAGYGSSENAIVLSPVPGMPKDALGMPQEGVDVAVVDPDSLRECPRARFDGSGRLLNAEQAVGEIVGRNVVDRFEGYWNNPEAEAQRTRNGWYWSGDLGYRDESGLLYFAGRSGEWLRVDAENFAVAPVERILARFPGARAVAVFPVPDERTADDQVMAVLELEDPKAFDADAFAAFLDAQPDLGTKWAPRYVRLADVPVGATGKIDKRPLRAERWDGPGPVWWRPERRGPYVPFTAEDRAALLARFAEHERDPARP